MDFDVEDDDMISLLLVASDVASLLRPFKYILPKARRQLL